MYYLFITKQKDLDKYKSDFDRVKQNMFDGKTPVYNEMRATKTMLIESFPYNIISGAFLIIAALFLQTMNLSTILSLGVAMIVNSFCDKVALYIFTLIKHNLRIRLCNRLNIEPSEENIAVMESLEYQTV